jgi:hypothetical protein
MNREQEGQEVAHAQHQADPGGGHAILREPDRQHNRCDIREAVRKKPRHVDGDLGFERHRAGGCRRHLLYLSPR